MNKQMLKKIIRNINENIDINKDVSKRNYKEMIEQKKQELKIAKDREEVIYIINQIKDNFKNYKEQMNALNIMKAIITELTKGN